MIGDNFFKQNNIDEEKIKEGEELFVKLVQRALSEPNSDFFFIKSWAERIAVKEYIAGVNTTITIFSNLAEQTYKTYLDQIKTDQQDLGIILALKQFIQCRDYYMAERSVAEDMLAEYRSYIWGGHIWDTLVGNIRKEEDMVDYRTLPVKWF